MELRENRTELEQLLADVWDYEDGGRRKTGLPKWLFAVTLTGAVLCTFSPSDVFGPVATTLGPAAEKTLVDKTSSENLDEDLDYRIAAQTNSPADWRAFLETHPDGPHAQTARAELERLVPKPPQPVETTERSPPSPVAGQASVEAMQSPPQPLQPAVMVEREPAPSARPVAEQPLPALAAAQTPVVATQSPPPPAPTVMTENEPAVSPQPVEAAAQSPPSAASAQTPIEAAQSPPPAPTVIAENELAPADTPAAAPDTIAASAPLPPLRPREVAVAKSEEPTHHRHWRAEHRQGGQPNVFTILVSQLFPRRR